MKDERTQFQVDRIAFFSDAVIAIAITLMILEIKIPPLGRKTTLAQLPEHFGAHTMMMLVGMLVCFLFIGNLWIRHHDLYRHVHNYNHKLVRTNLYFLLMVMLMPLSTSFAMEEDNPAFVAQPVFFINLGLCYLVYLWQLRIIFNPRNRFAELDERRVRDMRWGVIVPAAMLLLMAVLSFLGEYRLFWAFLAVPVINFARKKWGRRFKIQAAQPRAVLKRSRWARD
ncbi:TMEM175 family protein [Dinghuibacter silviterrae]|uniref:Putative membrane protein n=1 Tax=Dinghuibacter silviterrae TaxID=1539049 RepID=A0A4V3GLW8_9BACT|nr:TMEM175 family protein [Dinghuibacter silviterrae]TDX01193.1 putative membrane protein [Dinghuibacter silviterrae]